LAEYITSYLDLAYGTAPVKMGRLANISRGEIGEKRLYIFDGFDDYRIATFDVGKDAGELTRRGANFRGVECLVEPVASTHIDGGWMHRKAVSQVAAN
jgi:hypothetical protein